jgi:hypothetical protein
MILYCMIYDTGMHTVEAFCAGAAYVIFRHASPCVSRGLGERSTRGREYVREYARKVCGPLKLG